MSDVTLRQYTWGCLRGIQKDLVDLAYTIGHQLENSSAADFMHDGYYFKSRLEHLAKQMKAHMDTGTVPAAVGVDYSDDGDGRDPAKEAARAEYLCETSLDNSPTLAEVNARRGH